MYESPPGPWSPNAVSRPLSSCAASVVGLPATLTTSNPYTPSTLLIHTVSTGRNYLRPSSVSCTLPTIVLFPPDTGSIPSQLTSWSLPSYLPCQKALPGCWTPPVAISGLTTQPCCYQRKRGNFGACPLVCARSTCPCSPPSPQTNVSPLHPPPCLAVVCKKILWFCATSNWTYINIRKTKHIHCYKLWYLFLYFRILHSKSIILLGLCLVFANLSSICWMKVV